MKNLLKYLLILYFTIFSVAPSFASSISPLTVPTGGQVASGTININQSAPGKLVVNQTTNQGIINWQSFNVGVDAAVHFNTPNASAGTLNNISGGSSTILGSIYSNGRLFFANPSGIIFKPGSQVKAEGLVASAMRISNQDFLANNLNFTNNQIASLQNEGDLQAQYVALIAPQVSNKGTITTNVATMIAAGDDVKLSISDSNRLSVNINPAKIKTLSANEGVIKSENGTVSIQANIAQELINQTINTPRSADKLISENGVIKLVSNTGLIKAKNVNLSAGRLGGTEVSGTIDASTNAKGGDIEITGKEIQIKSHSQLLATGETGGGNILVGGDWQGSNGVLQATYTTVEKDTLIDVSSKGVGDGGKIVVWSDIHNSNSKTVAQGKFYAKANVGDGGKIETSGSTLDTLNTTVNTSSVTGNYGTWLIDPTDINIDAAAASTYVNNLITSNVNIQADNTINVNSSITYSGARSNGTLTFTAPTTVLDADVTSTSQPLNIIFTAASGSTSVNLNRDVTINTLGGNLSITGNIGTTSTTGIIEFLRSGVYKINGVQATATSSATSVGGGSITYTSDAYTWTKPTALTSTKLLVVAGGGGGGGSYVGGGGGAGGVIQNDSYSLTSNNYSISIGGGGVGGGHFQKGTSGNNSIFGSLTAIGGGGGGACNCSYGGNRDGISGGSGGGASFFSGTPGNGTTGQGNRGAYTTSGRNRGGGGGGAGGVGGQLNSEGTNGGIGIQSTISGDARWYAGGGGAGTDGATGELYGGSIGGSGVGGTGGAAHRNGSNAIANTGSGGGGGGGHANLSGGSGSDGIVTINYNNSVVAGLTVNTGAGQASLQGSVSNLSNLTINSNSSSSQISGVVSGTGALTKSGSSILTLLGSNTYTGTTTISAGTLSVTGTLGSGTYAANIANAGTLAIGSSSNQTLSGVVSGTGALSKSGSGTLTLSGANTYSAGTTLTAGQISLGANQSSSSTSGALGTGTLTMNGGTLGNTSSSGTIYNNILVNTGVTSTLKEIAGSNLHLAGNITGSGTLQVSNTSGWTVSLAGDNSGFTGTYIQPSSTDGNTGFFSSTAGSANATWELSGGRFVNEVSGGNISLGSLYSNATSGYLLGSSGGNRNASYTIGGKNLDSTFTGIIQNNYPGASNNVLSITKSGTGTLTLSGANTFTGATTISAGTLSASSLADTTALSVESGATYKLDQNDTVASIAGAGNINLQNRTLTSAGASDTNFSGIISGTGGLTLTGSNNLTLSGANTYSGTTHINGGGLVLANSNALASNSITSTSGRLKTTERISNLTVAGNVTLIGDVATSGAQTYNNNVTIGAGSTANPLTISSQNSDITFSGTVKTGSGAKAAQRSLTVNAGTGNVNFNDRIGYDFNGIAFNAGLTADSPYALSVTGGNITLKGDVMTFETQTYNGAVKIGGNGSNGTTRTLLSMDPKITFNGTVDDTQTNTHTIVAKAVQIRDNVLASGAPEVNFNRSVSSITRLAGYQGLTGYQIVSNEFGSIDPSASFGAVKLPPSSSSSSSSSSSQSEQRNIERKISSLKTNVEKSSSNTKTGMTLSQMFSSFKPQAGTSFVKSIEIIYPDSPNFGAGKINQNLPADVKSNNDLNQNKSNQTKPNNQQNQKQNSSGVINDDERL